MIRLWLKLNYILIKRLKLKLNQMLLWKLTLVAVNNLPFWVKQSAMNWKSCGSVLPIGCLSWWSCQATQRCWFLLCNAFAMRLRCEPHWSRTWSLTLPSYNGYVAYCNVTIYIRQTSRHCLSQQSPSKLYISTSHGAQHCTIRSSYCSTENWNSVQNIYDVFSALAWGEAPSLSLSLLEIEDDSITMIAGSPWLFLHCHQTSAVMTQELHFGRSQSFWCKINCP